MRGRSSTEDGGQRAGYVDKRLPAIHQLLRLASCGLRRWAIPRYVKAACKSISEEGSSAGYTYISHMRMGWL